MPSYQVSLDTRNAILGASTPFNCALALPIPIREPISSITLKSAALPLCWYAIRQPFNRFTVNRSGTVIVTTVPEGNYSVATLLQRLTTNLQASTGLTCTFQEDSITSRIALTTSAAVTIVMTPGALDLAELLGFTNGQGGTSIVGVNAYNINHDTFISIVLDNVPSSNLSSPPQTFSLPLTAPNGSLYFYMEQLFLRQTIYINGNLSELSQLRLRVTDRYGTVLNNQGQHWTFLLEIETE